MGSRTDLRQWALELAVGYAESRPNGIMVDVIGTARLYFEWMVSEGRSTSEPWMVSETDAMPNMDVAAGLARLKDAIDAIDPEQPAEIPIPKGYRLVGAEEHREDDALMVAGPGVLRVLRKVDVEPDTAHDSGELPRTVTVEINDKGTGGPSTTQPADPMMARSMLAGAAAGMRKFATSSDQWTPPVPVQTRAELIAGMERADTGKLYKLPQEASFQIVSTFVPLGVNAGEDTVRDLLGQIEADIRKILKLPAAEPKTEGMTFSEALEAIKAGKRVRLEAWGPGWSIGLRGDGIAFHETRKWWEPDQEDMLSTDWQIVE